MSIHLMMRMMTKGTSDQRVLLWRWRGGHDCLLLMQSMEWERTRLDVLIRQR